MEFTPVKSSNVSGVRFDEAAGVISVRFRDGSAYSYEGTQATFDALLAAESKGKFVRTLGAGVRTTQNASSDEAEKREVTPLNSLTEEADSCCRAAFRQLSDSFGQLKSWECPKCGQEYRPKTVGAVTVWEAHVWIARF